MHKLPWMNVMHGFICTDVTVLWGMRREQKIKMKIYVSSWNWNSTVLPRSNANRNPLTISATLSEIFKRLKCFTVSSHTIIMNTRWTIHGCLKMIMQMGNWQATTKTRAGNKSWPILYCISQILTPYIYSTPKETHHLYAFTVVKKFNCR